MELFHLGFLVEGEATWELFCSSGRCVLSPDSVPGSPPGLQVDLDGQAPGAKLLGGGVDIMEATKTMLCAHLILGTQLISLGWMEHLRLTSLFTMAASVLPENTGEHARDFYPRKARDFY